MPESVADLNTEVESALSKNGWVENRFRLVEERIASLEEGKGEAAGSEWFASLTLAIEDARTVGALRARLASFDPATPLEFEVDGQSDTHWEPQIWTGQTLDEEASTPMQAVYDRRAIIRLSVEKDGA